MPSDQHTVRRRFSPRGAFWYTAVCAMHSSQTYQCPPLCSIHLCWQWKALIRWLHVMASLRNEKSSVLFIVATFITEVLFKQFLICTALWQVEHSWQRRVMDTSVSDDNRGARHHHIFHSGYFDYRRTFQTVPDSYCCVTG